MRTGSGPLYSSITKNWFQSQLLRWRERGSPSSDSMTHFVRCRILSSTMPLTPVSKWGSGRRVYSSELSTRRWALITPSTSSFVKVFLFLWFTVSSRLCLANRDLAAILSLRLKLFAFLAVLGRVFESSLTFWCGISKFFKFFKKWSTESECGKTCSCSFGMIWKSRSSFKRSAVTKETCFSMKRNSRRKCAAMTGKRRSRCFKETADQVQVLMEVHLDRWDCLPPPWSSSSLRLLYASWLFRTSVLICPPEKRQREGMFSRQRYLVIKEKMPSTRLL